MNWPWQRKRLGRRWNAVNRKNFVKYIVAICLVCSMSSLSAQEAAVKEQRKAEPPGQPVEGSKLGVAPSQPGGPASAAGTAGTASTTAIQDTGQAGEAGEEPKEEVAPLEPGNITVNFKGADMRTVLNYIAEVAGIDIVPAPDVKGPVDVRLTNKPWKVALDIILRNYGYAYEETSGIIRVDTISRLREQEPITQTYSLDYASAKTIAGGMKDDKNLPIPGAIKDILSEKGKIAFDDRTNILVVTDVPSKIDKINQVIKDLDAETPQVLIEAKVIETQLEKNETMGIDWTISATVAGAQRPTTIPFLSWQNPLAPLGVKFDEKTWLPQGGPAANSASTTLLFPSGPRDGSFGFPYALPADFTYGTLDFTSFQAVLQMLKNRTRTEVISDPRVATLNNKPAYINVGETFNFPLYERNMATGRMEIIGYRAEDHGIKLNVTPHINTKNEIWVELAPEISEFKRYDTLDAASGIKAPVFSKRKATTQVLVRDGDTIFIGGIIKENNTFFKSKMPILGDLFGDIPYIGGLFSQKADVVTKVELIFFITVRVLAHDKTLKGVPDNARAYSPTFSLYENYHDQDRQKDKNNNNKNNNKKKKRQK